MDAQIPSCTSLNALLIALFHAVLSTPNPQEDADAAAQLEELLALRNLRKVCKIEIEKRPIFFPQPEQVIAVLKRDGKYPECGLQSIEAGHEHPKDLPKCSMVRFCTQETRQNHP